MKSKNPESSLCTNCQAPFVIWRKGRHGPFCKKCANLVRVRRWKEKNPERRNQLNRESQERCKVQKAVYNKEYSKNNPEKVAARQRRYREKNPEAAKASLKRYYEKNRAHIIEKIIQRVKWPVTPSWANLEDIARLYEEAKRITKETRIPHQVDHVIPLKGRHVSGLHVSENLQIISKYDNQRKANKFNP